MALAAPLDHRSKSGGCRTLRLRERTSISLIDTETGPTTRDNRWITHTEAATEGDVWLSDGLRRAARRPGYRTE